MKTRVCVMLAVLAALVSHGPIVRGAPPPDPSLRRGTDDVFGDEEPSGQVDYDRPAYDDYRYTGRSDRAPRDDDGYDYRRHYGPPNGYRAVDRRDPVRRYDDRRPARMAARRFEYAGQAETVDRPPAVYDRPPEGPPTEVYEDQGPNAEFGFHHDGYYDDFCDDDYDYNGYCSGPCYVRAEYLLWWIKGDPLPPLVTTSSAGTPRVQAGVLGEPNTSILFGNGRVNDGSRSGGRIVLGWWADCDTSLEGEYFGFGQVSANFNQTSSGDPILARPFFNLTTGLQDANVIAFPGQLQGTVSAADTSRFSGAGLRTTHILACRDSCYGPCYRLHGLLGYRYLRLKENLTVNGSTETTDQQGAFPPGSTFVADDSFTASNNFNGADIGFVADGRGERWSVTAIGHLGIGATWQRVTIAGNTTSTIDGVETTTAGGLLAMPTNIGTYRNTGFSVVPQLELKLNYDVTCNLRLTCGYDLIYWSRVVRPGDQIDTFVNTSQASGNQLVGTPGPLFAFRESDLWATGLSFGGEFCW